MSGVGVIRAERERQVAEEGWTTTHDDEHDNGALARAAAVYAIPEDSRHGILWVLWPISWRWKPSPDDRVRELAKAGALIAAEIDRLQRVMPERAA